MRLKLIIETIDVMQWSREGHSEAIAVCQEQADFNQQVILTSSIPSPLTKILEDNLYCSY